MKKPWTKDDDFRFTIELALSKAKVPAKRSKAETADAFNQRRKVIADKIVAQIKLSNWTIERGPVSSGVRLGGTDNE